MDDSWQLVRDLATSPTAIVVYSVGGAVMAGVMLTRMLTAVWARIARRTNTAWDDQLAARLGAPVSAVLAVQLFRAALAWVPIDERAADALRTLIGVVTIVFVIWGAFRTVDLVRGTLEYRPWARDRPASRSLIALGARFAKVAVLVMGSLILLAQLGISVASLIAGLGIGGLVIALAAQKTVENLFGAVSIGVDQPMREGDFVKIYDFVGTVEQIGLRSTRIRTLDRTLITIPNGELANQRIESYTVRDRMRLACMIRLEYRTTAAQLQRVLEDLEKILRAHPKIWPDAVVVRLAAFGESSLDIEIMAWFQTKEWSEFQKIRQDVLLEFMQAIEGAGAAIAVPARNVQIAQRV